MSDMNTAKSSNEPMTETASSLRALSDFKPDGGVPGAGGI
eukprot:CAMPEP_0183363798 /NCGR_PEP_ID=MMETSP0164_2-20130417/76844_1 /TAXON_ID=221442 /ORGANISM="Coccolithus pelagicus ssp braarudi, Strain PLY182g" /LENGTH=39 /DNA_ID= /DNA_START= /DNA_END= /DNA_ORIENTATION=